MFNILIVDDDVAVLDVFTRFLLRKGYYVKVARSYEDASQLDENERFDAAIMDIILPDGNGIYLIQKLKVKRPKLFKIMISGSPSKLNEAKELRAGDVYFLKPVKLSQLVETLNKHLGSPYIEP